MTPSATNVTLPSIGSLKIEFDHHGLFNALVGSMAELLETIAGIEDACAYVSSIAARLGADIEKQYKAALGTQHLNRNQLVDVLIDLKNRAGGSFSVIEQDDDHIVFGNCACPLGKAAANHPSLCMLTSNIFGRIAANTVGYAAVDLEQTIARGAPGCRVVLHLKRTELGLDTREYFRDDASTASA
ncbi:methanogen output domain 1-containing protein [Bosea vestrisii]|uniref:methanogen output domain 1-containing protein n=1 Tax=Bosea vestrisii TaxID=151416 RepID=UPI0024DF61EF|nr:methanogen output domain 1-containing protein [Bosea vestrisii]WID96681.1 methanogen output domain 1-containing protein [Bosea vestrisii]